MDSRDRRRSDASRIPEARGAGTLRRREMHAVTVASSASMSMREKLLLLEARRAEAEQGGGATRLEAQHEQGQALRARAARRAARRGQLRRARPLRHAPLHRLRARRAAIYGDGVVTGYGRIDGRLVYVFSPGLHRLRRLAVRGARREDLQDHGPGGEERRAGDRAERLRRRAHPGGRRLARRLRRHLPAQHARVGRRAADLGRSSAPARAARSTRPAITDFIFMVRGTSYMFVTGPNVVKTVTHEDVTMEELGGADTHAAKSGVSHFTFDDEVACLTRDPRALRVHPAEQRGRSAARTGHAIRATARRGAARRGARRSETKPYDMHDVIRRVVDDGEFVRGAPRLRAATSSCGFAHLGGYSVGIVANQPAVLAGVLDIDASRQGGALHPLLRRLQHPDRDLRGRARLPARRRAGARRHHPARRQAAVRLLRGDRAEADRDHPQGVRRRVRRDERPSTSAATSTSPGRPPRSR